MRVGHLGTAAVALLIATGAAGQDGHGAAGATDDAAADVSGDWALSFEGPAGSVNLDLDLTQDGHRLRGFAVWGGNRILIERGRVEGQNVSFRFVAGDGVTHQIELVFEGTVNGETMAGTMDGWGHESRAWTAVRPGH